MNYYNEFDPFAAGWLRELIKENLIPDGEVDERSITDVKPDDLKGYAQCHFFAGIGGWSHALQLANWPADRNVWTGSCPCQPFSSAGNQKGKADDRHLWPVWLDLIRECRPATIFGEQVASAIAHGWLDDVYEGLESESYAVGSAVLPACGVGAPHKRDRLWFVAHSESERSGGTIGASGETPWRSTTRNGVQSGGANYECGHVAHPEKQGSPSRRAGTIFTQPTGEGRGDVADTINARSQGHTWDGQDGHQPRRITSQQDGSAWAGSVWIECPDGKQRLIEPSIRLLAHGVSNRVGKLRGYGNAIVPQVAAKFIEASM